MTAVDLVFDGETDEGEAVLGRWYYGDGDHVESGAVVCEVMISKAAIEVTAPISGRLFIVTAVEQPVTRGMKLGVLTTQ